MIEFILNDQLITSDKPTGSSLLDLLRNDVDLHGTKVGCREGDCGACTVLEGTLQNGQVKYISIVSCLTPVANINGKHIVTVEGINMEHLSHVQNAVASNGATQCGFCTPGIVMSLTAHCLSEEKSDKQKAVASLSGNICRCTGYKSIEKAAYKISELLKNKNTEDPVTWLAENKFLPCYFLKIPERLAELGKNYPVTEKNGIIVTGGTDLMVQKAEELAETDVSSLNDRKDLKGIKVENHKLIVGGSTTLSEFQKSSEINKYIPEISSFFKLISSEPVRNMGTLAGNIANASPIGDLTILFLALNAELVIYGSSSERSIPLRDFFLGYKKLNIIVGEIIKSVTFTLPGKPILFNFEKVSKRTHLDIASVNSAVHIVMENKKIKECYLSAGGVGPIPLFLTKTCEFLKGKLISPEIILEANSIMQGEISPISDVRGSKEYKSLLLRQLFYAHFIKLFPGTLNLNDIMNIKKQNLSV
jgi:xanthine dehydrogenase small subunit